MDLDPKSPKQWICRKLVGKLGSNESDKHNNGFRWQQDVINTVMMKKTVLSKVRGELFLYIVHKLDYKFGSRLLQYFFLNFLIPNLIASFFFYIVSPFHLHLPCACQTVCVDTCPNSTPHKSSYGSCMAKVHCSGITSTLMRLEN